MTIAILNSDVFKTNTWSGGTTTELFIHPERANFKKHDFDFRLSKAKVDDEATVFTSLPDVTRKLMVLDGEITLNHEGHYSKTLVPLAIDTFDGGWRTASTGTCTDFNLMTTGNTQGDLLGFEISKENPINHKVKGDYNFIFIYSFKGQTDITIDEKLYQLGEDSLMVIRNPKALTIQLHNNKSSRLAMVMIPSH